MGYEGKVAPEERYLRDLRVEVDPAPMEVLVRMTWDEYRWYEFHKAQTKRDDVELLAKQPLNTVAIATIAFGLGIVLAGLVMS